MKITISTISQKININILQSGDGYDVIFNAGNFVAIVQPDTQSAIPRAALKVL